MTRPWTLPGAIDNKKEEQVAQRTPSVYDFDVINDAMERIKKEEGDKNGIDVTKKDDHLGEDRSFYPSYYGKSDGSFYMSLLLDEDDKVICPDSKIQELIKKYGLKIQDSKYDRGPPNRVLP